MKRRRYLSALGISLTSPGWYLSSRSSPSEMVRDILPPEERPAECPQFTDGIQTVCYQDIEGNEPLVYLEPSKTTYQPLGIGSVDPIIFTLYNNTDGIVQFNPYSWEVHEHTGGQWELVAPEGLRPQPLFLLQPGKRFTWGLSPTQQNTAAVDRPLTLQLSNGTYAFTIRASAPSRKENGAETSKESEKPESPDCLQSRAHHSPSIEEDEHADDNGGSVGLELVVVFDVTGQTDVWE